MNTEHIICLILAFAFLGLALWIITDNLRCVRRIDAEMQRRRDKRTRINARAPEHPLLFAPGVQIRVNADGTLPEWIQIAPFGEWPTRDGRAVQRFHAEAAEQIISWFNFWPRRIARLAHIQAVKVWVGHPDFAPEEWPERIELGSITELSADEQGLNARVSWAAGALTHVTKHRFPSVAWDCDVIGDGIEVPALLWSVGMWHQPNIKSVKAVINALSDDEGEGELEAEENAEVDGDEEDSIEDAETRRLGDWETRRPRKPPSLKLRSPRKNQRVTACWGRSWRR
ncbi:hypothetical protein [Brevifollis gellanilyticus]|uniref:Uncharacterized protein n=1 Tax=Brevifollis gellanilyticus TaxID=748831 RepID=A0A512MI21_9BACT|nr:hypothetical protein [Brevifollis gellanilyticus]GEP46382.1 hypothetical protein BGE01nite_56730 [Brevifollis gellanilyticus]